jgi:putative methyltransferase (TIGR04325 family)
VAQRNRGGGLTVVDPKRLRSLVPPALLGPTRRLLGRGLRMSGPYPDWDTAQRAAAGYAAPLILERVVAATREVVAGRAAFERDGVAFAQPAPRFPLLASLLHAAALGAGRLHVLDFGGALGSVYWQYRAELAGLADLRWTVVEQPAFVEAGRREFAGGPLQFAATLEEAARPLTRPLVLMSSVLQYLPDPAGLLDRVDFCDAATLLIDRTPVSAQPQDRVCVQHVAPRLYSASYPSWVFARERLLQSLGARWRLRWALPCDEGRHRSAGGLHFEYEGFYLGRRA